MMAAAIRAWSMVLSAGMARIESAGTPLILKLRKMPASRDVHQGSGRPSTVLARRDEDHHRRDHGLRECGVDLGHHQPHHGVEAQREQVVHQQQRGVAQAGLELEGEVDVGAKALIAAPPDVR